MLIKILINQLQLQVAKHCTLYMVNDTLQCSVGKQVMVNSGSEAITKPVTLPYKHILNITGLPGTTTLRSNAYRIVCPEQQSMTECIR